MRYPCTGDAGAGGTRGHEHLRAEGLTSLIWGSNALISELTSLISGLTSLIPGSASLNPGLTSQISD